jgi:hypothetical protein
MHMQEGGINPNGGWNYIQARSPAGPAARIPCEFVDRVFRALELDLDTWDIGILRVNGTRVGGRVEMGDQWALVDVIESVTSGISTFQTNNLNRWLNEQYNSSIRQTVHEGVSKWLRGMNRTREWRHSSFNLSAQVAEFTNTTRVMLYWSPIRHPEEVDFPPELLPPRGGRALPEARGKYSARFMAQLDADGRGGGWDAALSGTEVMAVAPKWIIGCFHIMGRFGGLSMDPRFGMRPYAYAGHIVASSFIVEDRKHALMTLGLWQYNASFMNPHTALHGLYFPKNGSARPPARLVGIAGAVKCDNVSHFVNETVALLKLAAKHTGRRPILPWIDCA